MRRMLAFASCLIVLLAVPAVAQPRGEAVPLLVTSEWLAAHLDDPQVVVLWTDQGSHDEALIPGARAVPHESLMTMQGGHQLAAPDDLVACPAEGRRVERVARRHLRRRALGRLAVLRARPPGAHAHVAARRRPRQVAVRGPANRTNAGGPSGGDVHRAAARAAAWSTPATCRRVRRAGPVLLDARSSKEYDAGRIPGAKLLTWTDVFADPRRQVFKSRQELIELFRAAGAGPGSSAITYCQIGLRSSALYFAARYAGLDVANYVGSWSDWTARGLPVEGR